MPFKPTTLERAYQLAEGGTCQSITDIKDRLKTEGYSAIQDQLHGLITSKALREKCKASYKAPAEE